MKKGKRTGIRELKNRASKIVGEVQETGEEYVVTKRGEPVAVIRPWREEDSAAARRARAAHILSRIEKTAGRVARAATDRSAVAAVSAQRR